MDQALERLLFASRIAWSRLPRRLPSRSRPTARCGVRPGVRAALHTGRSCEILADRTSDQRQNWLVRMRIIVPCGERGVARQAAEDEQPRIGARDERQAESSSASVTTSSAFAFAAPTALSALPVHSQSTSASPCFRAITITCVTAPTRRSTGWSAICCGKASRSAFIRRPSISRRSSRRATWSAFRPCRSRGGPNIGSGSGSMPRFARTSPSLRRTSSISRPGHRRPPRGQLGAARENSGRGVGPHAVRDLSHLLPPAESSSRSRAVSCAASIAAATRSWLRRSRWPPCFAPSA